MFKTRRPLARRGAGRRETQMPWSEPEEVSSKPSACPGCQVAALLTASDKKKAWTVYLPKEQGHTSSLDSHTRKLCLF